MLKQFNMITLTMIPKIENPSSLGDYISIVYYTVIYKVISKVLVGRLGKVLDRIY